MTTTFETVTANTRFEPPTQGTGSFNIALERHYSVQEIATMWNVSANTARRTFWNEPGVIMFGSDERLYKRGRKILRVPESVLLRVHQRQRAVN